MPLHPARLPLLFATLLCLLLGGCFYYADDGAYVQRSPGPAYAAPTTALVIVMPDDSTEADYVNWRGQIVDYLIQRGYIASESDLIANPDNAQRIVRAIVGNGGFTLSVFNKDGAAAETAPLYLEDSDVCYPEDPYFILGFAYFGEIGPRHLPPRPPGYRPHPHPPGYRPPANRPNYDWSRHWSGPHNNPPANRPRTPDRPPDNHNNDHGPNHNEPPHNPPPPPRKPSPDDHRDRPGHDDHAPAQPPAKPTPQDHRTDYRPNPDRNDQPHDRAVTPPPRSLPANNPPPRLPDRPVERPAPPQAQPKQQDKQDPKDDDKRQQQER